MCGIFGYFNLSNNQPLSDESVMKMGDIIHYRGPDGRGVYHNQDKGIALGNQRLAILDVEHGQQPFFSDDRQIVVVQNGEIFNHKELAVELSLDGYSCVTQCDTEVILRLYESKGIEGLSKLNGMFAIAIYDADANEMYLVRDRVGEKPLYVSNDNGRVTFASEIKSLLSVSDKKEVNYQALNQFLAFNYVPPPLTMFDGVTHIMPGHYMKVSDQGVESTCWWDLSSITQETQSEAVWIQQFNELLDDAVRIRLRSDVPFGAFLSGGVDSSSVVGLMSEHLSEPVNTFCIGFDDVKYDESPYAKEASVRFKTKHFMEKVKPNMMSLWPMTTYHCDQPHGDVSFMPTFKVASLASKHVKMVLTGDGADELFAGYDKYLNFFSPEMSTASDDEFQHCYMNNLSLFSQSEREKLLSKSFQGRVSGLSVDDVLQPLYQKSSHMDRVNQALYIDTMLLLPGNNLVKPDRMGMAVSLENRAPFLDYRVVELAFSMPGDLKLNNGITKYIYKKAVAPLIGDNLAYRKKQMFTVPVGEWFKSELSEMCEDLLFVNDRGVFNMQYVKELYDEHIKGVKNNTRQIRALMSLEVWYREFFQ